MRSKSIFYHSNKYSYLFSYCLQKCISYFIFRDDDNYADNTENPENEQGNQNNTAAQTQNKKPAWLKTKKSTSNKNKSNKNKFSNKANSNKVVLETKDTGHKDGSVKDEKHKDSNKEKDNDRDSVLDSDVSLHESVLRFFF